MEAHVGPEVLEQAEEPLVLAVALRTVPDAGSAEHGTALREEVENEQVARLQGVGHLGTRVLRPSLHHPHGPWVGTLHGGHELAAGGGIVHRGIVGALVEGVHGIVVGASEEARQLLIVDVGYLVEPLVGGREVGRPLKTVPQAGIADVQREPLLGVVGHHAAIARQHGVHAQLPHAAEDLLLQLLLAGIPRLRQGTAPPLQVVHGPPGQEGGAGNEAAYLIVAIAQAQQHVAPDALLAHHGQRHVHAVEHHPVNFLLPARPVPEGHGIREGAVVEVVAQRQVGFVAFLLLHGGHHLGQADLHLVPAEVYAGMILQVPVQAHANAHPRVAPHHGPVALLVQLEEVAVGLLQLNLELARGTLVDALQQVVDGGGHQGQGHRCHQ